MRKLLGTAVIAMVLAASTGLGAASAAPPAANDLPASIHGAVETQAVTLGNGVAALLVDPGTAYAYSTLDRDDYGEGSVSFTMTARGANLNLGTIAYAVIWAAPSCDTAADPNAPNAACVLSGGVAPPVTPNTGLHEARGFPAYAEALYPPPPADSGDAAQDRVYKCVVNKDGPGAKPSNGQLGSTCKQSDAIPLTAWAEAIGDEYRATGFSRAAGFDLGTVKVGNNESFSQVVPIAGGKVVSEGYSVLQNISLLGGQITIDSVRSEARIVSAGNGDAKRSAACTFAGLKIQGQTIKATNGSELPYEQVAPLLKQVADATGYLVELIPPAEVISRVEEGSKQVVSCAGFQVKFTDTHTDPPVPFCLPAEIVPQLPQCIPALANREELAFGRITVQQAVTNAVALDLGGAGDVLGSAGDALAGVGAPADTLGTDLSATGPAGTDLGLGTTGALGSPTTGGLGTGSGSGAVLQSAAHTVNSGRLGALAAISSLAWLVTILVLVGVVNSLASGRRLRLPGF
jgi:hypothetical protein